MHRTDTQFLLKDVIEAAINKYCGIGNLKKIMQSSHNSKDLGKFEVKMKAFFNLEFYESQVTKNANKYKT